MRCSASCTSPQKRAPAGSTCSLCRQIPQAAMLAAPLRSARLMRWRSSRCQACRGSQSHSLQPKQTTACKDRSTQGGSQPSGGSAAATLLPNALVKCQDWVCSLFTLHRTYEYEYVMPYIVKGGVGGNRTGASMFHLTAIELRGTPSRSSSTSISAALMTRLSSLTVGRCSECSSIQTSREVQAQGRPREA